jgi:hypothetical protein
MCELWKGAHVSALIMIVVGFYENVKLFLSLQFIDGKTNSSIHCHCIMYCICCKHVTSVISLRYLWLQVFFLKVLVWEM